VTAPKFGEWLPIETAPKNGDEVLLFGYWLKEIGCDIESAMTAGCFEMGKWFATITDGYACECEPTHWMPLPPPPTSNNETKD
jgi:hypothetical protein